MYIYIYCIYIYVNDKYVNDKYEFFIWIIYVYV